MWARAYISWSWKCSFATDSINLLQVQNVIPFPNISTWNLSRCIFNTGFPVPMYWIDPDHLTEYTQTNRWKHTLYCFDFSEGIAARILKQCHLKHHFALCATKMSACVWRHWLEKRQQIWHLRKAGKTSRWSSAENREKNIKILRFFCVTELE